MATIEAKPSFAGSPVCGPELTIRSSVPCETKAVSIGAATSASETSGPAMTRRIGSPNLRANSKSRSSWAGTAMIAPVP